MSEKESFTEKLGGADTAEVEALWKEALREFMAATTQYSHGELVLNVTQDWI